MAVRTKRGAVRRYNAIVRKCYRELRGGTQYGIDLPTLMIVMPVEANEIIQLKAMYSSLPD